MLSRFKNFCKNKQSDLFIIITIILVALISFGIGRLTAPKSEPVLIKNLEQASVEDLIIPAQEQGSNEVSNYQGKVVGSKNSDTYQTITEMT